MSRILAPYALALVISVAGASLAACGGGGDTGTSSANGGGKGNGGNGDGGSTSVFVGPGSGGSSQSFDVEPAALQTIDVTMGQSMPTVKYKATRDGSPVNVTWTTDRADVGTVPPGPSSAGMFTPSGASGGLVQVTAKLASESESRKVLVKLSSTQNGPNNSPGEQQQIATMMSQLASGGGVGGVGGEGLGPKVSDQATLHALNNPSSDGSAQKLVYLYPYDKTVWPRGMLAPLLQWSSTVGDADAVKIEMSTTSGSFSYSGTFGRPMLLGNNPFVHHPVPQDMWDAATNSAGGLTTDGKPDRLTVKLTIAKGGMGYGPISETYTVAPGRLTGTVYYNSYGTQYVKNWGPTDQAGNRVGAAILGVRSGDTAPNLVVGLNSNDDSGCRVCHVVASKGRWLLTQSEQGSPGDGQSYYYDLKAADVQGSAIALSPPGAYAWAALTGDADYALSNTINPSSTNPAMSSTTSTFYQFGAAPMAAPIVGLPNGVSAGYPSYSADDKMIAYVDASASTSDIHGPIMVGKYDAATHAFSAVHQVAAPMGGQRIGYPVFLPDNSGVVFETQVRTSQSDTVMVTRNGTRSELWWLNLNGTVQSVRLDSINGKGYAPLGPNNHGASQASDPQSSYDETGQDDSTLNYEPTVLPVVAGGYAWVVFTSRRMYGNELQSVPWQSWPPSYNTTDLAQGTVKKLWVAAIDLSAPAGSDPGHPAFYLPAQELLAGNSRGFWVLDPCKQDGMSCESGDQCCNGFCEPNQGGMLVCSPPEGQCSGPQEKCKTSADCCDSTNKCINGFCAVNVPH
jgi:hypothetical protein